MCGVGIVALMRAKDISEPSQERMLLVGAPIAPSSPVQIDGWWAEAPSYEQFPDGKVRNLSANRAQTIMLEKGWILLPNTQFDRRPLKVKVLKQQDRYTFVEITEGPYAGKQGWTNSSYVR